MTDKTTISVTKGTRDALTRIGRKAETYDDIIARLLEREEE